MTTAWEPRPPEPELHPAPVTHRCLLLADADGPGPALLAAMRRLRDGSDRLVVRVVVPFRHPVGAGLLIGDPLAGWVALDSVAVHEWDQATRLAAERHLSELRWLLWEMEIASTGEVLAEEHVAALIRLDGAGYDSVVLVQPRSALARWRRARWVRNARRTAAPALELVQESTRHRGT